MKLTKQKVTEFVDALRALGIGGFAFGALLWIPAVAFYKGSETSKGQVVNIVERTTSRSDVSYATCFTFVDSRGVSHTVTETFSSPSPDHRPGETVPVRYRPEMPSDARIDDFSSMWGLPTTVQSVCTIHFLMCSAILYFLRGREPVRLKPAV